MVVLKSASEIAAMRSAGRVVADILAAVSARAAAGVRLVDLDAYAAEIMAARGARPSFLDYHPTWAPRPYPGVLCLSVNEAIVHGIPDDRQLHDGDLLSIDCGVSVDGYHADAALTVGVGPIDAEAARLTETTDAALAAGIAAARPDGRLGDISHAVEVVARRGGYGLPRGLGGHGIGTAMHEEPHLPNTGRPRRRPNPGRWLDGRHGRRFPRGPRRAHGRHHGRWTGDSHDVLSHDLCKTLKGFQRVTTGQSHAH